jgi:hypothetical protein
MLDMLRVAFVLIDGYPTQIRLLKNRVLRYYCAAGWWRRAVNAIRPAS